MGMTDCGKYPELSGSILGQGMAGTFLKNGTAPNRGYKLMKTIITCEASKVEYQAHLKIYQTLQAFLKKNPQWKGKVDIPVPLLFSYCKNSTKFATEDAGKLVNYHCAYGMEVVKSYRPDGLMEHITFDEDVDQIPFVDPNTSTIYKNVGKVDLTQPNQKHLRSKGPRGVFLSQATLAKRYGEIGVKALATRVGILFEIIQAAGYQPKDVEYVLGPPHELNSRFAPRAKRSGLGVPPPCVYAIDFGMVDQPYTNGDFDFDLYVPHADPKLYLAFEYGRSLVRSRKRKFTM